MTKAEVIEKVRKLRAVAKSTNSKAEADTATKLAEQLRREHKISEEDLRAKDRVAAFDELVERLDTYARSHKDMPAAVAEVLFKLKEGMSSREKEDALDKITAIVQIGSLFLGRGKIGPLKEIVSETLRKHGVSM